MNDEELDLRPIKERYTNWYKHMHQETAFCLADDVGALVAEIEHLREEVNRLENLVANCR